MRETFGQMIGRIRGSHGLTGRQAAKALGFSAQYLCDLEHDVRTPGPVMLDALSRVYDLDRSGLYAMVGRIPADELPDNLEDAVFAMAAFKREIGRSGGGRDVLCAHRA